MANTAPQESKWLFSIIGIPILFFAGFIIFFLFKDTFSPVSGGKDLDIPQAENSLIRSDLAIPTESSLLDRPKLLTQIDDALKNQRGIQSVALVGPGGAGKTTLARQYAHQLGAPVIWEVNAETQESLKLSFENLAQALSKTSEDKKILRELQDTQDLADRGKKIIQFIKERLRSHSNWILIYDNVEKYSDIQEVFPQDYAMWGKGKVLITTRDSNIQNNKHVNTIVEVKELEPEQKFNFFIKIMNQDNNKSDNSVQTKEVRAFLEYIPPYPLDVSVAAYYLKSTQIPYAAYLENITKYNKDFESTQESLLQEAGDYTKTRYGIISLSLEHMINTNKDFCDLLLFMSLLDSQNIPRDLLDQYKGKTLVDNFIYNLKKYSLITNEFPPTLALSSTFSLHRSTQAIALAYLVKLLNLEKNKHIMEPLETAFINYIAEVIDKEDFPKMNLFIRHSEMFLSHAKLSTDFVIASISSELGRIHRYLGNYEKAKQLLEQNIINYKKNSYENHPRLARALGCLGNVYRELGNYEKAKQCLEEAFIIYNKNSYGNHPWFARILVGLGVVYSEQGNYEKAIQLYEEALIIYRKNSYENHPGFARTLAWLGIAYRELGNYEKAKQLLEQGIIIYKKTSYESPPWFARVLAWLGSVYRELGEYKKAKYLLERSIQIYKSAYGKDHVNIAPIIMNLGLVYRLENDMETAEALINKALRVLQRNGHPDEFMCLESLSELYFHRAKGEYKSHTGQAHKFKAQANSFLKQALEVVKTHFPKDSPHLIRLQDKLKKLEQDYSKPFIDT